jgi:hypothetical protein
MQMIAMATADTSDRIPETTGVGRCSPAIWMARYVEPQQRYTLANATRTRVDFETPLNMSSYATGQQILGHTKQSGEPKLAVLFFVL